MLHRLIVSLLLSALPVLAEAETATRLNVIETRLQTHHNAGSTSEVLRLVFPGQVSFEVQDQTNTGDLLVQARADALQLQDLEAASRVFKQLRLIRQAGSNELTISFHQANQEFLWERVGQTLLIAAQLKNENPPVHNFAAETTVTAPVTGETTKTFNFAPASQSASHARLSVAELPPVAAPESVEKSGNLLQAIEFDHSGDRHQIWLKLSSAAEYTLESVKPGVYKVSIPSCSISDRTLELPYFPPVGFKGLKFLQARNSGNQVIIEIHADQQGKPRITRDTGRLTIFFS